MGAVTFSIDERLVEFLARELGIEVFVETGTFHGDSLTVASSRIGESHSVELSQEHFDAARRRFADRPDIHLSLASSPDFLRELRPRLRDRKVLYWLDAHWCVADNTAGEDSQSPLLQELEAIGEPSADSVICIDDARLFLCPPPAPHRYTDWPDFHTLCSMLLRQAPRHRLMVLNDVIIVYPVSIDAEMRAFAFEHGIDWLHLANLVLRPAPPPPAKKRFSWFGLRG